jgi:hypothetical protein
MTDLTNYPVKMQLQLIKANGKVSQAIADNKRWEEVKSILYSVAKVSPEVESYFFKKYNS